MKKINLFIDVDGVTIDSTSAMASYYNHFCSHLEGFIPAIGDHIKRWDGTDEMPLLSESGHTADTIFQSEFFFENVEIKPYFVEAVQKLIETGKYNIYFLSIGSPENISHKVKYLQENIPFIENQIMLVQLGDLKMDKSVIDMADGILIDDHENNLKTCNATLPLMFADTGFTEWNSEWLSMRKPHLKSWKVIAENPNTLYDMYTKVKPSLFKRILKR